MAQCPSTIPNLADYGTGTFSIRKVGNSCIPVTVSLKSSLPGSTNIRNVFDYRGGTIHPDSITTDSTYTYPRPGIYTIIQFSEKDGRQLITCPKVYVPDTLPPKVNLVVCGGTSARINFDRQTFEFTTYKIDWGDGIVQSILPYIKSVSHSYATSNTYTIKVWGVQNDGCRSNNAVVQFNPAATNEKPIIEEFRVLDSRTAELKIDNPLQTQVLLYRKNQQGIWESTGRTIIRQSETLQVAYDSLANLCFRLVATDSCLSNSYASDEVCSSVLQVKGMPRQNELSWVIGKSTSISKVSLTKDGAFFQDLTTAGDKGIRLDDDLTCRQEHCYQLIVETTNGSRFISLPYCRKTPAIVCGDFTRLHVPDAFSPNGDGINDLFEIKGNAFSEFELTIYSPWGSVLFNTQDVTQFWDGTIDGTPLPSAAYPYSIKLTDPNSGDRYTQNGSVKIIR